MSALPVDPIEPLFQGASKSAVLLVDLQHDFLHGEGRMPVDQGAVPELLACVAAVVAQADAAGVPTLHIVNAFPTWRVASLFRNFAATAGTPGAALDVRAPHRDAPIFTKSRSDAFSNPELEAWLRASGVERLIVLGVYAEGCVRRTVEGARARGFEVLVPRAGVASRNPAAVARGLAAMTRAGASTV